MMKVLLINPPWVRRQDNVWHNVASIMPPLGLAWIAAVLELDGHQVQILDAHAERIGLDQILDRIRPTGPFDFIGITSTTSLIHNALEIARMVKVAFPGVQIILGGVHPTVLPEEVLAEPAVDIVVRGEGEDTMKELAARVSLEGVLGISYRKNGAFCHNADRPLIADLNSLPMPAYHLLPMGKYRPAIGAYKRLPGISMLATRGCPGRCTFCYRIFGPRLRARSGLAMAKEVQHLHERYGIREISFYDDTFTAVKKEIRQFCQSVVDMGIDVTWSCFSRVDAVDKDILQLMKRAGCHQIMYGIESASPEVLANIHKNVNLATAERAVAMTQEVGINVRAAFMLGNPGETEKTMRETLKYAIRLNPGLVVFNITTPFPGTEMFDWAKKNGYLKTMDWDDYDLAHQVMELPSVPSLKVQEFYRTSYRRFFLRPRYVYARLRAMQTLSDVVQAFRGLRAVIGV